MNPHSLLKPFITGRDAAQLISSLSQQASEAGLTPNAEAALFVTNKQAKEGINALVTQLIDAGHEPKIPEDVQEKLERLAPEAVAKVKAQAQAKLDAKNASVRAAEAAKKLREITAASKAEREKAEASKTTPSPVAQPASNLFGFDRVVAHYQAHGTKTANR